IKVEFKVKGMICSRCIKVLNNELRQAGAEILKIDLGRVLIEYNPNKISQSHIERIIQENDFELIINEETLLAEKTKRWVINYIWNTNLEQKLSEYILEKMQIRSYEKLSRNFSKAFEKTIERYCVLLKIERAKEMVEYGEVSLSEIAYGLGYQNLSGLSRQFKKETGMTLREYKKQDAVRRIPLDRI
ncbi:MAG: AraC family transcriptional regulator, partial [Cyclobacteriaceae bacterium]